jgi:enamine deaminase RidA (YjgF/YER057c/UK114 family)
MGEEEYVLQPGYTGRRPYCVCRSRYPAIAHPPKLQLTHTPLGGWDHRQKEPDLANLIKPNLLEEIDQAFENVDYNLKHAGGKGWSQVYRVVTYSTNIAPQHDRIVENFRKWMPDHCPVWTELGVKELGLDVMNFEIDVEAYDEEGAAEARKAKVTAV